MQYCMSLKTYIASKPLEGEKKGLGLFFRVKAGQYMRNTDKDVYLGQWAYNVHG